MKQICYDEGEAFSIDRGLASRLRVACARLQHRLKPSFSILSENNGLFKINGVVGTIDIGANTLIEISPKTQPDDDWIHAVLDLLIGSDRVDAAGERAAGLSPNRRSLLEVLASVYAARLERAIRRDGPILLMRHQCSAGSVLKGKLDVTKWATRALWQPHRFPVAFNALSVDHEFSRALVYVAQLLAKLSRSNGTQGRLISAARALRPGQTEFALGSQRAALHPLPSQWAIYQPAWSIAVAILSQRSLLRSRGKHQGVSIVIEVWPLLERLLERSLHAAVSVGRTQARSLEAPRKTSFRLLTDPTGAATEKKSVEPDGRLMEAGHTVATFEVKYKRRVSAVNWPDREDIYQALVAAAACESPLSVLVYPESFPTARWRVVGMQGRPIYLVAVGLGLFSYRFGAGDIERGKLVLDILDGKVSAGLEEASPLALVG